MAAAEAVGGDRNTILPFAIAAELFHTYTLIHDDLPALDNDDLGEESLQTIKFLEKQLPF
ncbi:MAG: hypothetical protein CM1200mP16_07750 [Nitrospina sp.]|nr:MAG: hypothetical protein CM1200mP16_07750 [Nitrospina sp.]